MISSEGWLITNYYTSSQNDKIHFFVASQSVPADSSISTGLMLCTTANPKVFVLQCGVKVDFYHPGRRKSAVIVFALYGFAHGEGYVHAFSYPSTQQIGSHDAHILLDLWERSLMMQLSGITWQTSDTPRPPPESLPLQATEGFIIKNRHCVLSNAALYNDHVGLIGSNQASALVNEESSAECGCCCV